MNTLANDTQGEIEARLHKAAEEGDIAATLGLITERVDLDAEDDYGETALHKAVREGHTEIAIALIAGGADVDAQDGYEDTPLHVAAREGYTRIATALIAGGADMGIREQDDYTPLYIAAHKGNTEVALALIDGGADPDGAGTYYCDTYGHTPSHEAALQGQTETMNALIKAGADPNARDDAGHTPIDLADEVGGDEAANGVSAIGARPKREQTEQTAIDQITSKFVMLMESKRLPPWAKGGMVRPVSGDGKPYTSALNAFLLAMQATENDWIHPEWFTQGRAQRDGHPVRPEELHRGTTILSGRLDRRGNFRGQRYELFNREQCEGMENVEWSQNPMPIPQAVADAYLQSERIVVTHGVDVCTYSWREDLIRMRSMNRYVEEAYYYIDLFHEIAHSTSHPKRLNRQGQRASSLFRISRIRLRRIGG